MIFQEYCDSVGFVAARHQKKLIAQLDSIKSGGVAIVAWPPRSGKTTIANLFKDWLQKLHPDWSIGMCNYLTNRENYDSWFPSSTAQAFIIDDYFKSMDCEELKSLESRQSERNKIERAILNYVDRKAPILMIQTRMHYDDLFGWVELDHDYEVSVSQDATPRMCDNFGEIKIVSYWPEKYPLELLSEIEKSIPNKVWRTMYEQCPPDQETVGVVDWRHR